MVMTGKTLKARARVNNFPIEPKEAVTVETLKWLERQYELLFDGTGKNNLTYKARSAGRLDARILRDSIENALPILDGALRHICAQCERWMDEHDEETGHTFETAAE